MTSLRFDETCWLGNGVCGSNKINKVIPKREMRVCGKYIFPKSLLLVGLLVKWSTTHLIFPGG